MACVVNIDGTIVPSENAQISVFDRGFLYGDSVYEVIRTYKGVTFAVKEHLDRLERSAASLAIDLPQRSWLIEQLHRTVESAGNQESYCRIIVTRGQGPITLDPTTAVESATIIIVKEFESFSPWMYTKGIRVGIPSIRRTSRASLDPAIKSGNYLNSVMALGEARRAGFDDALLLDTQEWVTEATSANVFTVHKGLLSTPTFDTGLLAGVTRGLILQIADSEHLPCEERQINLDDLISAQEVMLTSTLREIMPVVEIQGHPVGTGSPGPISSRLLELFRKFVGKKITAQMRPG
jgi:branched-chain amino acid aminotransferase